MKLPRKWTAARFSEELTFTFFVANVKLPANLDVAMQGTVQSMNAFALVTTGTTVSIMSLIGVLMLTGIPMSNSILIVEFAHQLLAEGRTVRDAVVISCRVRLRPVLITSLATIIGLLPMAMKLGEGSESYAPLARALIAGLTLSVIATVFIVPVGLYLAHRKRPGHVEAVGA